MAGFTPLRAIRTTWCAAAAMPLAMGRLWDTVCLWGDSKPLKRLGYIVILGNLLMNNLKLKNGVCP